LLVSVGSSRTKYEEHEDRRMAARGKPAVEDLEEEQKYLFANARIRRNSSRKDVNQPPYPDSSMDKRLNPYHPPQRLTGDLLFIPITTCSGKLLVTHILLNNLSGEVARRMHWKNARGRDVVRGIDHWR
jgi:hypothetical protein